MKLNMKVFFFTLYAPYVAIPHIRIISREIAEAMHMSENARTRRLF